MDWLGGLTSERWDLPVFPSFTVGISDVCYHLGIMWVALYSTLGVYKLEAQYTSVTMYGYGEVFQRQHRMNLN